MPFESAIKKEMDGLIVHWFETPSFEETNLLGLLGGINADFLGLVSRSNACYRWLLENPNITRMLADRWKPALRYIQKLLRAWFHAPNSNRINWLIETFWPAFIRSYPSKLNAWSYAPIDLWDKNNLGQSPIYWLLDAALFMQTTGKQIHMALGVAQSGDRARLYQFDPAVFRQIHAIGISPSWICTTTAAAFRDMGKGEIRPRLIDNPGHEGGLITPKVVVATCTATFNGLKDFMATLRALGKWRGIINCCLNSLIALGNPVTDLRAFAEEPTVPKELRRLALECASELEALLKDFEDFECPDAPGNYHARLHRQVRSRRMHPRQFEGAHR